MSQQGKTDRSQYFYRSSAQGFMKIPGNPIAYWVTKSVYGAFEISKASDFFYSDGVTKTGNNDKYVRLWWECNILKIKNTDYFRFYSKGGAARYYYGNLEYLVKWDPLSRDHYKSDHIARISPKKNWEQQGITWSDITSGANSFRLLSAGEIASTSGPAIFEKSGNALRTLVFLSFLNTKAAQYFIRVINPTIHANPNDILNMPFDSEICDYVEPFSVELLNLFKDEWDSNEFSYCFKFFMSSSQIGSMHSEFKLLINSNEQMLERIRFLLEKINCHFVEKFSLDDVVEKFYKISELSVKLKTKEDLIINYLSYTIGCIMGRYSIDKPGLILASQGETLQDYLYQIPNPRFMPDHDAILPLTDQEWFADDVTNRVREFVKVVWGEDTLQENLAFIAESLCLHAIKGKKGESAIETIRRYLSTQFYKDHLKTYKKRPIYWLFSSGKEKAFECLVYLHRYNESTLARMRTEYVTPLMGKYDAQQNLLQEQLNDASPAQQRELEKQLKDLAKKQTELRAFDENLKHYADMRIKLDLDDGVKVNYGKFGNLLAEVKNITGDKE